MKRKSKLFIKESRRSWYLEHRLICICFIIFFLFSTGGCWKDRGGLFSSHLNVIFISIDTLRADHLSTYGYPVKTSPKLDEFALNSTLYTKMYSVAPWTLPAHASMFTGLHPYEHGARTYHVETKKDNVRGLADHHVTLAEVLRETGYTTAAMGANKIYIFNQRYGLQQGFQTFEYIGPNVDNVNSAVIPWIRQNKNKPFFLFLNYMDTHRPYNTTPRPGLIGRPVFLNSERTLDNLIQKVMGDNTPPPEGLVQIVTDQYDTAVANLDEGLGVLFDELRNLSLFNKTLIIVTSDHGEYFGEHRLVEHSKDIYQEALFVPLIVKMPHQTKGEVNETPASSVDIPDIILAGIGLKSKILEKHPETFPYNVGSHPIIAENYYTRLKDLFHPLWGKRFNRVRRAWFEGSYKYISSSDGQNELYDLEKDPGEQINLVDAQSRESEKFASKLIDFLAQRESSEPNRVEQDLTESEKEAMKSLGYL